MSTASRPSLSHRESKERSLDLVQRAIMAGLVGVVFGSFAAVLALYLVLAGDNDETLSHGDVVGLWVMTGVLGLVTAAVMLVINRRRPYSPWVLFGLLPMAASGYWILI